MTVGQRLRSARESRDMTIGDIARRTFIQPKFIQAIDEDNLTIIPDSHRRLFVREYAKIVGVESGEILSLLAAFEPPPPPVVTEHAAPKRQRASDRWKGTGSNRQTPSSPSVPPSVSALDEKERKAYGEVLRRLSSGRGMKLSGSNASTWLIGGAFVLLLMIAAYYIFFSDKNAHPDDAADMQADSSGSPTEILARGDGDSTTPAGAQIAGDDSLTLEGRATAKVWFAIVMDGKRSETGTLDSGAVKVWRAAETFKLSLGNAGGLSLTLNDSVVGALGPLRTSIRNQIIDVNGVRRTLPGRRSAAATPASAQRRTAQNRSLRTIAPTDMRTAQPTRP